MPFSNLSDADSLTKTWKVNLSYPPLSPPPPALLTRRKIFLGLHQGRQLPGAGPATRELELEAMASPESHGRQRQCQVQARLQEAVQVHE